MHGYAIKSAIATLALNVLMAAVPVQAGDWWVIASTRDFCAVNDGATEYNWKGSGSECHSFVDPDTEFTCVYTTYSGSVGSAVSCSHMDNPGILSVSYLEGMGNGGVGCDFWSNADCTGQIEPVTYLDETENCYEFNTISPLSFSCP